jgi:septum formation protein
LNLPKLILASGSPRRKQILEEAGISFVVDFKNTPEAYPSDIPADEVAAYLARLKAEAFRSEINNDEVLITADTIVLDDHRILGKPADAKEAFDMLRSLSGKKHRVITGVCIFSLKKEVVFSDITEVYFSDLDDNQIDYYIKNFKPFDKAGAYGIQEWIGLIGIEKISGSYFNVVGLPIHRLYQELKKFQINS